MTGFGRAELEADGCRVAAEIRSVNHRYLDLNFRLPRKLGRYEAALRELVKGFAERGKVDVSVTWETLETAGDRLVYHAALAGQYADALRQMSRDLGLPFDVTVRDIAALPEVFTLEHAEEDEEKVAALLERVVKKAGKDFQKHRSAEGTRLKRDILKKLTAMDKDVRAVEKIYPQAVAAYSEKLAAKIREYTGAAVIDENRILTEVAVYADKTCVDEETVRLASHIESMRQALKGGEEESVGRKLDFIAQEMNREANTILSKCSNIEIADTAVRLKTEIEKIREQVQNIE